MNEDKNYTENMSISRLCSTSLYFRDVYHNVLVNLIQQHTACRDLLGMLS